MKQVIYSDGVVTKLQVLKDELDNKYGNKKTEQLYSRCLMKEKTLFMYYLVFQ